MSVYLKAIKYSFTIWYLWHESCLSIGMILKEDAAKGLFLGLAIGDAMGSPIEFEKKRTQKNYVRSYLEGGFHKVTKGEFTDDTSMALAMADAMIESQQKNGYAFDPYKIMDNFLKWRYEGKYSPRGECFDVGVTVCGALAQYKKDRSGPFTGSRDPMSAGNGGLMRLAPALIASRTKEECLMFARETTRLTHGAEEALMYSEIFAEEIWEGRVLPKYVRYKHPLNIDRDDIMSGGYVKETYQAAWWAYQTTDNFEDCIIEAINLGHDSDTTGAVAGMIAGRMYGFDAIPKWMVQGLQWSNHIIHVAKQLCPATAPLEIN